MQLRDTVQILSTGKADFGMAGMTVMLPFIIDKGELPFENGDYIFIPEIQDAIKNKVSTIKAFVVNKDMKEFELKLDELTDDERQIILDGCLINYYRENK